MHTYLASHRQHADLSDDALVHQARLGDHGAFEALVDRYSDVLLRLITQLVRDEHLAHDVLQYVFLQLYLSLPTLRTEGTLKGWVCQVARHRCLDELRRKRPICFSEFALDPEESDFSPLLLLPDPHPQPQEQIEQDELRERLLEAIETLPTRARAVVLLRYARHLSYREIAQELGIPQATAKTYFHRSKERLRALLQPEFATERGRERCNTTSV
jgi:RNA polymerase sigma factor (sigma-70 family)